MTEESRAVRELARELQRLTTRTTALERGARGPQLGHSSISSGSLDVVDAESGTVRMRIGYQPDGTVGAIPEGGDPPPAPTAPTVAASPVGLMVHWDGALAEGLALPADMGHVAVHVSQVGGFVPDSATFVGTIPRPGGVLPVVPLTAGETYYVKAVGVTTGGVQGPASAETSGVPESVADGIGPGDITETEIADDAITSPKIRALAVEAHHIVAEAIDAGHIRAGAVDASKLAATLILASRIIAGNDGADRVEIDSAGLRAYNASNELIFALQNGDATFSGSITGSDITGSRVAIGSAPGPTGAVEQADGGAQARMTAPNGAVAELRASNTQASAAAYRDGTDPDSARAGVGSDADQVFVTVATDGSGSGPGMEASAGVDAGGTPVSGLTIRASRTDTSQPHVTARAVPGSAQLACTSGDGGLYLSAPAGGATAMYAYPEAPAAGTPALQYPGALYAYRSASTDTATLSLQGPTSASGAGAGRRSMLHMTATNDAAQPHTTLTLSGDRIRLNPASGSADDGVVELWGTHTISAERHAPVTSEMVANPAFGGTNGDFHDFSASEMPAIAFRTPASGRVRIGMNMAGTNNNSSASTLSLAYRLSGPTTVGSSLKRAALVRSRGAGVSGSTQTGHTAYLTLTPNADYVLTPTWRISSGDASTASFDLALDNSITVEPLM